LGTWGSLHDKLDKDGNNNAVVNATVLLNNSSSNIISTSKDKLVIIDGLEDFIIVDKDNVLLIYPKSKEQEIKGIVGQLKK
jgi:mannose-1-phosphate guanylyltransferase